MRNFTQHKIGEKKCDYCHKTVKGRFYNAIVKDDKGLLVAFNGHEDCMKQLKHEWENGIEGNNKPPIEDNNSPFIVHKSEGL